MFETDTAYPSRPAIPGDYIGTIEDLQKSLTNALDTNSALSRLLKEKDSLIDNAKALILEAYDVDDFSEDRVEAIAEALDIQLTQEYDVTINVTYSGTVTVPLGFDIEGDLENYINFEAEANGWGTADVECDLYTDGVDVSIYKR